MPLAEDELRDVQHRVTLMFMDTIDTFQMIEERADDIFGESAEEVRNAINEYLNDFIRNPDESGEKHPETLIFQTPRKNFQRAGLYGSQLAIKEQQVSRANESLRSRLTHRARRFWKRPFKKWVDTINNFLASLAGATGLGEALKELKDCLRDALPDDENQDN